MPDFRAYIVSAGGHFKDFEIITAGDDENGVTIAETLVDGHATQLQHLDRRIKVVPLNFDATLNKARFALSSWVLERPVSINSDREELYRRLTQTRRLAGDVSDALTTERLKALALDIEQQLAKAEARNADVSKA
jgi:hypothetical protein